MNENNKSHEALVCGHCGAKNRMDVIVSVKDVKEYEDDQGPSFESGTLYEIQKCPSCSKVVLVSGLWHDLMESPEEWKPKVLLPEANDLTARKVHRQQIEDLKFMKLAVEEAAKSEPEGKDKPKVGAVVVTRDGNKYYSGYRGELAAGDHAEYTVLETKCKQEEFTGATVYTTLEPCTIRNHPKIPCATRLVSRKVARVVIGMLDPDERIRGLGVLALRKANIHVDLFPPDLMARLEEMNRDFISSKEETNRHPEQRKSLLKILTSIFR